MSELNTLTILATPFVKVWQCMKKYKFEILLGIMMLFIMSSLITAWEQVPSELTVVPAAGLFLTSDRMQLSLYITRMVDEDGKPGNEGVCLIQKQFPSGFFENCVVINGFYGMMDVWGGRITKEAEYAY